MKQYFEASLQETKNALEDNPELKNSGNVAAMKRLDKETSKHLKPQLEEIWKDFDEDQNGKLDVDEVAKLMQYYLDSNCEFLTDSFSVDFKKRVLDKTLERLT